MSNAPKHDVLRRKDGPCGGVHRRDFLAIAGGSAALLTWPIPTLAAADAVAPDDLARAYADYLRQTKGILDIRAMHESGSGPSFLDVVVVSAGFTADQMGEFHDACQQLTKSLLSRQPWARYRSMVNVFAVFVGDESEKVTRLKVGGHDGHVLGCDNGLAVEYARYAANAAGTIVLHNSKFACGGAGVWGVATVNRSHAASPMVPIHELGHGMAGLGDEYIQRNTPFTDDPKTLWNTVNVTAEAKPQLCKWHYWTEEEWPGLFSPSKLPADTKVANFEGAGWIKGIYRPEKGCYMRGDRDSFCIVCSETMEASFFRYIDPFKSVEPAGDEIVLWKGEQADVRLTAMDLLRQPPEWLKSRLAIYLDGERIASSDRGEASCRLDSAALTPGVHHLGANLNIQSDTVRKDFSFLSANRGWRATVMPWARPKMAVTPQVTIPADGAIDVPVTVEHENPALFAVAMAHAPEGAVLDGGRFRWKPSGAAGSWRVDFTATYEGRCAATASLEIRVERAKGEDGAIDLQPVDPVDVVSGKPARMQFKAAAKDGGHLLFEAVDVLPGVELNRYTGELAWTPRVGQAGPRRMRFRVRNAQAVREFDCVFRVRRAAEPSPVSYCNQYIPQTLTALKELKANPSLYRRLFETLRLLRARYEQIYGPALADLKSLYEELSPKMRNNCIEDLCLHAWAFADRPEILAWMRGIAGGEQSAAARELLATLGRVDGYNTRRTAAT